MGPPGVGKGTQAETMQSLLGVPHVSTGNILRAAIQQDGSPLGKEVRNFVESGQLVPDGLMGELIAERLGRKDAPQGSSSTDFRAPSSRWTILERRVGPVGADARQGAHAEGPGIRDRATPVGSADVSACGTVFHLDSRPPAVAGVCDACGSALVQRPDDPEKVIRERLKVYTDQTLPVADAYRAKGLLIEVDGFGEVDAVRARLRSGLGRA